MDYPNRKRSKGKERPNFLSGEIVLCLLICIISGLVLSNLISTSPDLSPTVFSAPTTKSKRPDKVSPISVNEQIALIDLKIKGHKEAHEPLTFHIPDFHGKVKYELELGNGDIIAATKPQIKYTYSNDGTYDVKLWGSCNGERKLLNTSHIKIIEGIEVADDAFVEVRR